MHLSVLGYIFRYIILNKRFDVLDSFRGICAVSVVLFHIHVVGAFSQYEFFRNSDIFVEFFFVLSGFVLAHGYAYKTNIYFKKFVKSRFFRLFPLHIFMLFVFLFIEVIKFGVYKYGGLTFNNAPFTGSNDLDGFIPNLLLMQSWLPNLDSQTFNAPSWSISLEFYMYILFFFTFNFFKSAKHILWLLIPIVVFYLMITNSHVLNGEVYRGLASFFSGSFAYHLYLKINHKKLNYGIASFIELMIVFILVLLVQSEFDYKGVISIIFFVMVVIFFSFEFGVVSKMLKTKYFKITGTLSYSIYMTHYAVVMLSISIALILTKITGIDMAPMHNGVRSIDFGFVILNNLFVLALLMLVVIISSQTHRYIEVKYQRIGKRF